MSHEFLGVFVLKQFLYAHHSNMFQIYFDKFLSGPFFILSNKLYNSFCLVDDPGQVINHGNCTLLSTSNLNHITKVSSKYHSGIKLLPS